MRTIENNNHRALRNALTVEEVRDALEDMPPDAHVVFVCDYGDHCHTQQALPVTDVDPPTPEEVLAESGYSHSGVALTELDLSCFDPTDAEAQAVYAAGRPNIVILRMGGR